MEPLIVKDKRKSQRIPVELTILAELEDRRIAMSSDNISLDGMFLFSREFVRPHAMFSAQVWLSNEQDPLQIYLTSCFTERTWAGYGIGAHISSISATDSTTWESFYRSGATESAEQLRQLVQSERTVRNRHLVVVDGALSAQAIQLLRKQGLEVSHVPSVGEALEVIKREKVEVVISDLQRPGLDGLALCCHVNNQRLPTRTVLLTSSATPREFLLGMYAGATRVIAKPCSNEILVTRILDVFQECLPSGRAWPADSNAAVVTVRNTSSMPSPVMKIAHSASQRLGQICRTVSESWIRPQNA